MRPLRLVLPAETVRHYRIIMLKVTHLPFVGIIWAYENSRQYVSHRVNSPPSTTKLFGSVGQGSLSRNLGSNTPRLPALTGSARGLTVNSTSSRERRGQANFQATDAPLRPHSGTAADSIQTQSQTMADLVSMVQKLSAQVDELTSLVASQQKD